MTLLDQKMDTMPVGIPAALLGVDSGGLPVLASPSGGRFNLVNYGAVLDARVVNDGTMSARTGAGNVTVTSATAAFTNADVGKLICINSQIVAATSRWGTVVSVESATSVTVAVTGTVTSISAGSMIIGTDNDAAMTAAIAAASAAGGGDVLVPGMGVLSGTYTLPTGVSLVGTGKGKYNPLGFVANGAGLVRAGAFTAEAFFTLNGGGAVRNMTVDAALRAETAVNMVSTGVQITNANIARGNSLTLDISSGSSLTTGSAIYGGFAGKTIKCGGDTAIIDNYIFGAGDSLANLLCSNVTDDVQVVGNHFYKGGWGVTLSSVRGPNILFEHYSKTDRGGGVIASNTFDTAYGNQIEVIVGNSNASYLPITALTIADNQFYQPQNFPDNTYSCIKVTAGTGASNNNSIRGLSITGNVGKGYDGGTASYKSFIDWAVQATYGHIYGSTVVGNAIDNCNALYTGGFSPDYTAGNVTIAGSGTTVEVA